MNRNILTTATIGLAATGLLLAGCGAGDDPLSDNGGNGGNGGSGKSDSSVVVGGSNFTESRVLAEIYAGALKAEGVDASTHLDIGTREVYMQALQNNEIGVVPEYTGNAAVHFDEDAEGSSAQEWYDAMTSALPKGLSAYDMAEAQDSDTVTVSEETAEEYDLTSIADLKKSAGDLQVGGPPEWTGRGRGINAIQDAYGLEFKGSYRRLESGLQVSALQNGQVDVTNIFSTNPAIDQHNFVVLEDPKNVIPFNNVVPLVNEDAASPKVEKALNAVSAELDTETLRDLNKQVDVDEQAPRKVARQWLEDNDLS